MGGEQLDGLVTRVVGEVTIVATTPELIVGLNRGARIYLINAPMDASFPQVEGCGSPFTDNYHCYDTKAATLAALIPD
jgi:hypothetical protein